MYSRGGKRLVDVTASLTALLVLSPVLALVALAVRLTSPGPAIFRQVRVGRNGSSFEIYKFRSLPITTEQVASDQLPPVKIHPFGRFIRRTNIDELPQLFNIVKGDMSLVGPRPPLPDQSDLIKLRAENGAIDCLPGLTGLAQVNSFEGMSTVEKARFDEQYARRITLLGDLGIVIRTIGYLLKPPPVY